MAEQEIDSDAMYGIAKKFNRDMEAFPMHTHSAIVEMVRVGMQHRNLKMQKADKDEADRQQERMLAVREQQLALMRADQDRQAAAQIHLGQAQPAEEVAEAVAQ